jgi:hypothetical protein
LRMQLVSPSDWLTGGASWSRCCWRWATRSLCALPFASRTLSAPPFESWSAPPLLSLSVFDFARVSG